MSETCKFRGIVTFERFYNEESYWGVFGVKTKDSIPHCDDEPLDDFDPYHEVIVAGKVQHLYVGSEYEFYTTPQFNKKYNTWQYSPLNVIAVVSEGADSSRLFLESILTTNQANALISVYPNIVQEVIDGKDDVDVSLLHGIGKPTWDKIKEKIISNYVISDVITLLQPLGVTFQAIKNLLKFEPEPSILRQKILDNPYVLTSAKGFGFQTVDRLALKIDPSLVNSGKRLFAYMKYYLSKAANDEGHTWVSFSEINNGIINDIPQCIDLFDKLVKEEQDGNFAGFFYRENDKLGLLKYRECETSIYSILKELENYAFAGVINTDNGIKVAENELGYSLTEEQKKVVKQIEKSNVVLFTGKAGVGKSTSARAILNSFEGCSIACCSLSAKAAQRIKEATGFEASTIHRLLGFNGTEYEFDSKNRLKYDVVFIDEASMLNCLIFYRLLSAIKEGAKVIICGDYAQLPPIGAGNVFSDLLKMQSEFNVSFLTKVHRQAEQSGILTDANKIREGIYPIESPLPQIVSGELKDMIYVFRESPPRIKDIAIKQYVKLCNARGKDNVVIAVPRKDTVDNSALELNKCIQPLLIDVSCTPYIIGPKNKFYIGDRVIQIENDGKRNIYNGEVGYVENVFPYAKPNQECMVVRFGNPDGTDKLISYTRDNLNTVLLGYAMSVHKLQGSEYDYTIVVLDNSHYVLLDTCLLYTGITRAKKMCLLISQPEAFNKAMRTNKNINRQTWLRSYYEEPLSS